MSDVVFSGPCGRIEGHYHLSSRKSAPTVIVMHPHPKHGGNMRSKLNYAIYKTFAKNEFNVLRFNFRGVGRSDGVYDHGEGEISDAAAALDWVQGYNTRSNRFWVAGFSFGAWVSLQILMRRPEIEGFVVIGPPANLYDFSFLLPCPVVGQIIQASHDSIVDTSYVDLLVARLKTHKGLLIDYQKIETTDHFLKEHIDTVSNHMDSFISQNTFLQSVA